VLGRPVAPLRVVVVAMEACHTPRAPRENWRNIARNIVVIVITKQGVFEWFSCGFSYSFSYPCSFGDTVIGVFGCEGYSSIYTYTSFELWVAVTIRTPLVSMWSSSFNFMFFYFHFHLFNFLFSGGFRRYSRRWYIRRLSQDKITGTGAQFRNQGRKKLYIFSTRGSGCWGFGSFIMYIVAYGTSIPFPHCSIIGSFVLWCFVCFGIYVFAFLLIC